MIHTILAFFGYVKIPKEAVQLSMKVEDGYHTILGWFPENKEVILLHKSAKTITEFLRSGRLL